MEAWWQIGNDGRWMLREQKTLACVELFCVVESSVGHGGSVWKARKGCAHMCTTAVTVGQLSTHASNDVPNIVGSRSLRRSSSSPRTQQGQLLWGGT